MRWSIEQNEVERCLDTYVYPQIKQIRGRGRRMGILQKRKEDKYLTRQD
jgi:hypothetical protein